MRGLSAEVDAVASHAQLRAWGLTSDDVRTQVRAGRWSRPTANSVCLTPGPLSLRQRWRVAVIETGCPEAAVDGISALQAAGLAGVDGVLTVSVAHHSRPRAVRGVDVRVTRWRRDGDRICNGVPRVRTASAAVHGALWARTDRQAALLVVTAAQQRLTTADRMRGYLLGIRRHPRRQWLARLLDDVSGGVHAMGELDFARLCRAHALPLPSRQVVRRRPGGRYYLDAVFDSYGVVAEIDGIQHLQGLAPVADAVRQNQLTLAGDIVLRIPVLGLRVAPELFVDQVREALARRGWPGAA